MQKLETMINDIVSQVRLAAGEGLVGAAEGCDLLILIVGGAEIAEDQKIAAFGSSYTNPGNAKTRFRGFL
ncbi:MULTISPECIES: hypothetical protein [unclassified Pseudomonas]|uniref:hypothetical protein n=1 Tax=Pseudomonas TaxID=286 RepID=UPI0010121A88|nr:MULTISPECIES: hypothetical protein [unclassified Pseudomonas]TFB41763.1 hypothetical protein E3W21_11530 [Pseudomonas sp. F01002]